MTKINLPANSQKVFEKITEIATFQIFQTDSLDYLIYGLAEDDRVSFNSYFELAGHDSALFILSIGTPWYYFMLMIFVLLLKLIFGRCPRVYQKLDSIANTNILIRFFQ